MGDEMAAKIEAARQRLNDHMFKQAFGVTSMVAPEFVAPTPSDILSDIQRLMEKFTPPKNAFNGRIIESLALVDYDDPQEDWSGVRSPSRAKRRRKKHRQNIRIWYPPRKDGFMIEGTVYMHPDIIAPLKAAGKI